MLRPAYVQWLHALTDCLMRPENDGRDVFIYLSREELITAGRSIPSLVDCDDTIILRHFQTTLLDGPVLNWSAQTPAQAAFDAYWLWQAPRTDVPGERLIKGTCNVRAPLHLPYLLCFTLPFSVEAADTGSAAYYSIWNAFFSNWKLTRNLTKIQSTDLAAFQKPIWSELWICLTRWSEAELQGSYGILRPYQLGDAMNYVGWPKSQCLITPAFEGRLNTFFADQALSSREISLLTDQEISSRLLKRLNALGPPAATRTIIQGPSDGNHRILLGRIRELWRSASGIIRQRDQLPDGSPPSKPASVSNLVVARHVNLILFADYVGPAIRLQWRVEKSEWLAPFGIPVSGDEPYQVELGPQWSMPIPLSVVSFSPSQRQHPTTDPTIRLVTKPGLLVFALSTTASGYEALPKLQAGQLRFLIQNDQAQRTVEWLRKAGATPVVVPFALGSEISGYVCYKAELRTLPAEFDGIFDQSARPERGEILPVGGLRLRAGDYLQWAPPKFQGIGTAAGHALYLHYNAGSTPRIPLDQEFGDGGLTDRWLLPSGVELEKAFSIRTHNNDCVSSKFCLVETTETDEPATHPALDKWMKVVTEEGVSTGLQLQEAKLDNQSINNYYAQGKGFYEALLWRGVGKLEGGTRQFLVHEPADELLYLLTASGSLSEQRFREAVGQLAPDTKLVEMRLIRRWLQLLGFAVYTPNSERISVLPTALTLLPAPDPHHRRALLTGARPSGLVAELSQNQLGVDVEEVPQPSNYLAALPNSVILTVSGKSIAPLVELARVHKLSWLDREFKGSICGNILVPTSAAWLYVGGTLDEYKSKCRPAAVVPPEGENYQYFDPVTCSFRSPTPERREDRQIGALLRYYDQKPALVIYFQDDCPLQVSDLSWGRYLVLKAHKKRVIYQHPQLETQFFVPSSAPLPGGYGLGLALMTGRAPRSQKLTLSPDREPIYYDVCEGVCSLVFGNALLKLNQAPLLAEASDF